MSGCQNGFKLPDFQSLIHLPASHTFTAISLFDLDHTLLRVNSSFEFGKFLYCRGVFSKSLMLKLAGIYALHKAGLISIQVVQNKIFKLIFAEKSLDFFLELATIFVHHHLDTLLYEPAYRKLKSARDQGEFVAILSASPDFLVNLISQKFEVQFIEASTYSIHPNRKFSHISRFLVGRDKAAYSALCSQRLGISQQNISAYSDCISDLPMLEAAGKPIAVRPGKKLNTICKNRGWEVI